jgi:mono/diheme cytochrome c family protein
MPTAFLHCLLVLQLAPASGFLPDGHPASAVEPRGSKSAQPASAIRIYRASCLKCHDVDGKGEIVRDVMPKIPDFTDAAWHSARKDADLGRAILEGKGKSMPPMRGKLGSVDVGQMVAFVRAFRGGKQAVAEDEEETPPAPQRSVEPVPMTGSASRASQPSPSSPRDLSMGAGSRTFQRSCTACHGNDGRGGEMRASLPSIPDFSARSWQEARTDPQLVVSVLDGKGAAMPPFRDKLSREQAREVIAFIRSFGPSQARATRTSSDDFEARFRSLLDEFEDLRRRSRAISADATPIPDRPSEPALGPPTRQARRNEPQSRGAGRRGAGVCG